MAFADALLVVTQVLFKGNLLRLLEQCVVDSIGAVEAMPAAGSAPLGKISFKLPKGEIFSIGELSLLSRALERIANDLSGSCIVFDVQSGSTKVVLQMPSCLISVAATSIRQAHESIRSLFGIGMTNEVLNDTPGPTSPKAFKAKSPFGAIDVNRL